MVKKILNHANKKTTVKTPVKKTVTKKTATKVEKVIKSKEYIEGFEEGKRSLKVKDRMGYFNPYVNGRPRKEEYKQFVDWNTGYTDARRKKK